MLFAEVSGDSYRYCPRSVGSQRHRRIWIPYCRHVLTLPHRALVNTYKLQPTPGVQKVGISLFFTVVDYVSEETQRHPPTRQFFTSCIEILGQVRLSQLIVCGQAVSPQCQSPYSQKPPENRWLPVVLVGFGTERCSFFRRG